MGQSLSEPETSKQSAFCQNDYYKVGSSCMQGWRMHMEDSHTHILSLPDDPGTSFFAVYDGHGGAKVAEYAGKHLHKYITRRPEYAEDVKHALQHGFLDLDEAMLNNEALREHMAGSTAVVVLIKDNRLYCANAGDSRAIACVDGRLDVLSFDHKPTNEKERERISSAGGYVEYNRVNGYLALSRALGDFGLKRNAQMLPTEQMVTAYPDVEEREVSESWDFLVIACDGIWDVLSSQAVMEFVQEEIGQGIYPQQICENLMMRCLAPDCQMGGIGGDNMTVIVVCFLHGQPYEELVQRCKEAVAKRQASTKKRRSHSNRSHESEPESSHTPPASDRAGKAGGNGRLEDESSGSESERSEELAAPLLAPNANGKEGVVESTTAEPEAAEKASSSSTEHTVTSSVEVKQKQKESAPASNNESVDESSEEIDLK
ncbi:probable protein phosphatase 2C T23F11.1 [Anopheles stephensi]|uniref:probable protein phosphatase 2C T23F11.1 n=1 Tax=Anopheles stephensi TaxID=30069 RepID=UPI0007D36893|nr:probable protein phosphatase 2C T23F11.1 [Anopheles stephensi]XP_035900030.1 probable protein phosphatase 2C T23F11.1 [Anopheles stephensi]XP_035900032.1 probable protein phosphatase 2C T23F11.1 [Anopheles stephensi]XP_035900033.1 probable protein phosphatase 2C T23F11.1 [Anopheles stephensi]